MAQATDTLAQFAMDFPLLREDGIVMNGHVRYCEANGHATRTISGVVNPYCPRCGAVAHPEAFPTREEMAAAQAVRDAAAAAERAELDAEDAATAAAAAADTRTLPQLVQAATNEFHQAWLDANPGKFETLTPAQLSALLGSLGREAQATANARYSVIRAAKLDQASEEAGHRVKFCGNCGGTGQTMYVHVSGGVCFRCDGTGFSDDHRQLL